MPSQPRHQDPLETAAREFEAAFLLPISDSEFTYHKIVAGIHHLCAAIREAELHNTPTEKLQSAIKIARDLHSRSPFVQRLQTWPRGYPGDFETIEYICSGRPRPAPSTPEHYIEQHCLRDTSAQQHRNKVAWQARACLEATLLHPQCSILSIACGGCRDLRSVQDLLKHRQPKIMINDIDSEALRLSMDTLPDLRESITPLQANVFNAMRKFKSNGPFHLILAGGLFDYLQARQIEWLLPKLDSLLAPGGKLCFTNVANGNPDRVWLHHIAEWKLIERSREDILQLLDKAGISNGRKVKIERDATGLSYLVTVKTMEQNSQLEATR